MPQIMEDIIEVIAGCGFVTEQKAVEVPQLQCSDKVVDVLVEGRNGRSCEHAATLGLANSESASDSVHRRSWWTFQFASETGTLSAGYGGDESLFAYF